MVQLVSLASSVVLTLFSFEGGTTNSVCTVGKANFISVHADFVQEFNHLVFTCNAFNTIV